MRKRSPLSSERLAARSRIREYHAADDSRSLGARDVGAGVERAEVVVSRQGAKWGRYDIVNFRDSIVPSPTVQLSPNCLTCRFWRGLCPETLNAISSRNLERHLYVVPAEERECRPVYRFAASLVLARVSPVFDLFHALFQSLIE